MLHKILYELKLLYANHAPQLKPRTVQKPASTSSTAESIDPVEDMFNILEGSALVPFIEVSINEGKIVNKTRLVCLHIGTLNLVPSGMELRT